MLIRLFTVVFSFIMVTIVHAESGAMEEIVVQGARDLRTFNVADTVEITPDSASLIRKAPGANVNGNGPLTGIPQYRGMYGARVNVEVNGMTLSSGGPNWMDPPLSYAPAAQLESLEVYRGIAPVSAGQETIGGAINAKTWSGNFSSSKNFESTGRIRVGAQSVNDGALASTTVIVANQNHRIKLAAITEFADDAEFDGGSIMPTEYDRDRYDLGYGFKAGAHTFQLDVGRNETGDTGTPALPMDIEYIDADLGSFRYSYAVNRWLLRAKMYYSDIEHGMTNYHLRQPPMMDSMWRRNIADGDNQGFSVIADFQGNQDKWLIGIDGHREQHDSNIDNINNPMFFVENFNNAEREILGIFIEFNHEFDKNWLAEFGLRVNHVDMDADTVDGTPAMMTAGETLRDNFNNADRSQTDSNTDWVAKFYYLADKTKSYYVGLSRKTRSASYQERYLWLPMQSTGGLADGRTYLGNLGLDSEVAHELELGLDYHVGALTLSPRLFYRDVDDYIQGTETDNMTAVMFVSMMNPNNLEPLEFNNVDAEFYGFDMDWSYSFDNQWSLSGVINYVRGKRDDISDDLYRIAPFNAIVALNYLYADWSASVESVLYDEQDKVSATNTEQETSGYGLLNIKAYWQITTATRLGFGVENLADKEYDDHLGGYNRAMNPDIAIGSRLPGYGRNIFARIDYQW